MTNTRLYPKPSAGLAGQGAVWIDGLKPDQRSQLWRLLYDHRRKAGTSFGCQYGCFTESVPEYYLHVAALVKALMEEFRAHH